jgi:hypothetical protein
MPAGMTIYNDSGAIQIDGEGIHYNCTGSGTVTTSSNIIAQGVIYGSQVVASFPTDAYSLYAFRCDTAGVHIRRQWLPVGGTTRNYRIWVLAPIGTTITWYRFEPTTQGQSNGAGFDIYTPTGAIAFSLSTKPMAIRELINVTRGYGGGTISLSANRNYAVIPSAQLGWEDAAIFQGFNNRGEPLYFVPTFSVFVKNNTGSVTLTVDQRSLISRSPSSAIDNNGQALIVDVTYL